MNYLTYGDKNNKSIVLIHGMVTTATVCYERILPFLREYYVILAEVDGHIPRDDSPLVALSDACTDVERYINTELGGKVYCLGGFSMGGTMATEIMARGNVNIDYGSNEPYPKRGAALLKKSFTRLHTKEIEGMGHGQYIMENPKGYAEELLNFLSWR